MLHPHFHALARPEQPAIIMAGTGETITFKQLDESSNQAAQLFRAQGLQRGDHMAFLFDNKIISVLSYLNSFCPQNQ